MTDTSRVQTDAEGQTQTGTWKRSLFSPFFTPLALAGAGTVIAHSIAGNNTTAVATAAWLSALLGLLIGVSKNATLTTKYCLTAFSLLMSAAIGLTAQEELNVKKVAVQNVSINQDKEMLMLSECNSAPKGKMSVVVENPQDPSRPFMTIDCDVVTRYNQARVRETMRPSP